MNYRKKMIQAILTVFVLLSVFTGCRKHKAVSNEDVSAENGTDIQENVTEESSNQEDNSEESDVTILENEGDIEIEIPEDMDSDGF